MSQKFGFLLRCCILDILDHGSALIIKVSCVCECAEYKRQELGGAVVHEVEALLVSDYGCVTMKPVQYTSQFDNSVDKLKFVPWWFLPQTELVQY